MLLEALKQQEIIMKIRPNDPLILDKKNMIMHFRRNLKGQCTFQFSQLYGYEKQNSYADRISYHEMKYTRCPYCFSNVHY